MRVWMLMLIVFSGLMAADAQAQTRTFPSPTPKPVTPREYSRQSEDIILADSSQDQGLIERLDKISSQLQSIARRLDRLEGANGTPIKEDKAKGLLTNLDIITKGEQRVESLRRQLFDVIDKQAAVRAKIDQLEIDARPESIDRSIAFSGTLRADELREARRKAIEAERKNAQLTLADLLSVRSGLEGNLAKAEALVEKLRIKFEKDIDSALEN